jgi:tetratricopeptide (TPR) repeat protein
MTLPRTPSRRPARSPGGLALVLAGALALACGEAPAPPDPGTQPGAQAPGLVEQALEAHRAALGRTWPPSTPGVQRAKAELQRGNLPAARALLQRERNADPDNLEALFLLGGLHFQKARFGLALKLLEEVLRRGPGFAGSENAFYVYGLCQMRMGDAAEARAAFEAVLEFSPGNGEVLASLGELDLQEGDVGSALRRFEEAQRSLESARASGAPVEIALAALHARLGDAWLQEEDPQRARLHFERAVELNPGDSSAHYALSRVLMQLGDAEGAERELAEYRRLRVDDGRNQPLNEGER